ncbi:MAG TPA: MgtC/SapB family protein [Polyangia bacterium]|jgi:uncharacterized membrane protein (DUF4010 family)|nr:MgtC/SapB family protein [Polyangia bacterium]
MGDGALFQQLGISVGLGLLVGLERQRSSRIAGFRTFPLLSLFGSLCGLLARAFGGWIVLGGLFAVVVAMVLGNLIEVRNGDGHAGPGITTEAAMLTMYGLGAWVVVGSPLVAIVVGGTVAVLLQAKAPLHRLAGALGEGDLTAIMRFVLVAFIILPVLPNRAYGPFQVLNPHVIWLMVVLIVGVSLAGYIAYRLFGRDAGMLLAGMLGGLISSTATTLSYARRAGARPPEAPLSAVVIATASAVLWFRLVVLVVVVAAGFREAYAPLLIQGGVAAVPAFVLWLRTRRMSTHEMPAQENPTELRMPLVFATLFAGISLAVAAAKHYLGNRGVYAVAAISGLTDVDAITLSMARLVREGRIEASTAWRVIVVAVLTNLVFKAVLSGVLGRRALLRPLLWALGLSLVVGGLVLWLW